MQTKLKGVSLTHVDLCWSLFEKHGFFLLVASSVRGTDARTDFKDGCIDWVRGTDEQTHSTTHLKTVHVEIIRQMRFMQPLKIQPFAK